MVMMMMMMMGVVRCLRFRQPLDRVDDARREQLLRAVLIVRFQELDVLYDRHRLLVLLDGLSRPVKRQVLILEAPSLTRNPRPALPVQTGLELLLELRGGHCLEHGSKSREVSVISAEPKVFNPSTSLLRPT